MAAVRSKDTRPELRLRQMLFAMGFRYRLHVKSLPANQISYCQSCEPLSL
ncbi:very short patch repair endonuclease [Burkholderia gladioli]|nr:very short patch repair endonuclease [Burkholderia gladioli]